LATKEDCVSTGADLATGPHLGAALLDLLSHDLRTPLGPLSLAASVIAEDVEAPEDLRELARVVEAQAARIGRLIDAALAATSGHRSLDIQTVDFARIAEAAAACFRALGGECEVRATTCVGVGDAGAIRDAITGLIECAAGDGGRATLEVTPDDASARFTISGDRSAECARALDAELPSDGRSAFALGARALVAAHGGEIQASEAAVVVRLPL
jgi:hypothetical protein